MMRCLTVAYHSTLIHDRLTKFWLRSDVNDKVAVMIKQTQLCDPVCNVIFPKQQTQIDISRTAVSKTEVLFTTKDTNNYWLL